jgi:outer membrane protein OmpA-like peptidoglycan-associated protein
VSRVALAIALLTLPAMRPMVATATGGLQAATVPLCPGLTIVTAVSDADGDYESIKTVESVTDAGVRLKYSTERMVSDMFSTAPPKLQQFAVFRMVRHADLQTATLYEQQFSTELPELVPETTAVGASAAVLKALKTKGVATLGIFQPYSQTKPPARRDVHPNVYDNQMVTTIRRVGTTPVMIPVIVNDAPASLPAIQAAGDYFGEKSEFFFLDDPANPMTLKFRFGIGGIKPLSPDTLKLCESMRQQGGRGPAAAHCDMPNGGDKDVLRVVKVLYPCAAPAGATAAGGGMDALERSLAETRKADVYSIFFSFNSDAIREESAPALQEIAGVLRKHPDWKLAVNGHTDGIGTEPFNLDLSKRRAAAVKAALVKSYSIDAARLSTNGFGKSQPKDTNDTVEGRAHNRRVELIRM